MSLGNILAGAGSLIGALRGNKSGGNQVQSGTETQESASSTLTDETIEQAINTTTAGSTQSNSTDRGWTATRGTTTDSTRGSTRENNTTRVNEGQTSAGQSNTSTNQSSSDKTSTLGRTLGFDAKIMNQLNSLLSGTIGAGGFQTGQNAMMDRLDQIGDRAASPGFDPVAFADQVTRQASSRTMGDLESRLNSTMSAVGGSETGNSMAALLGSRLRNDAAAELGGINASARATGEKILQDQQTGLTSEIAGISKGLSGDLLSMIQSLSGAQSTNTGTQTGTSTQTGTQATTDSQTTDRTGTTVGSTAGTNVSTQTGTSTQNQSSTNTNSSVANSNETSNQTNNQTTQTFMQALADLLTTSNSNTATSAKDGTSFDRLMALFNGSAADA